MARDLYREITIRGPEQLQAATQFIARNARGCIDRGTPIRLIITTEEQKRHAGQNAHYWGAILRDISEQAWVGGRQYSADTWHEYFAQQYAAHDDVTLPDGQVVSRRKSTTKMGVSEFADYMQRVEAYGATELGVKYRAYEE